MQNLNFTHVNDYTNKSTGCTLSDLDTEEKLANTTVNVCLARRNSDLLACLLYDFRKPDVLHDVFICVYVCVKY